MKSAIRFLRFVFLTITLTFSPPGFAKTYPWIQIDRNDIQFTDNPKTEIEARLWLIKQAKKTIDLAIYDHPPDEEVGIPILLALREAADRGVRVRFIRGTLISKLHSEPSLKDTVREILLSTPTVVPIQFVSAGSVSMILKGWSIFAGVHEKLLLIDRERLLLTGRGHGDYYSHWLDSCLFLKGQLVKQAQKGFNRLWRTVVNEAGHEDETTWDETSATPEDFTLSEKNEPNAELDAIKEWSKSNPRLEKSGIRNLVFARVLHNDLLKQIRKKCGGIPWIYNYMPCATRLVDPITDETTRLILLAESVRLYSLSTIFPDPIKTAIRHRLRESQRPGGRPFRIEIFTNSKQTHRAVIPYPAAWFAGLKDMVDLAEEGAIFYTLSAEKSRKYVYVHRKLALFSMPKNNPTPLEDGVIMGSHNFSRASQFNNDELSIEVLSTSLAKDLNTLFDQDVALHADQINLDSVKKDYTGWEAWGLSWFSDLLTASI